MRLYPHQEKALDMTYKKNRVAYYLDMGLGKTFVGSEKLWELNNVVNLVICQKSKIDDWVEHFKTYYPEYKLFDMTDTHKEAKRALEYGFWLNYRNETSTPSILFINYELAWRRKELLKLKDFTLLLDESSLIQNEKAKRSKFILKLNAESVILLSGTPTSGKYEKLWSQLRLLGWDISKRNYYNSYVISEWRDFGGFMQEVITGYKNTEHLKEKLTEYGAVFMKTCEVMTLPPQLDEIISLQKTKEYTSFEKDGYLEIEGKELVGDNTLTRMLYLRQLCSIYHKEKLQRLYDLISSSEERFIIFYCFTEEMERMKEKLKDLGRGFSEVNGHRRDLKAYEEDDSSITFIQYQAGAMGGNYQKSHRLIYYSLPLGKGSCDLWEQSKKRIHRIGQDEPCFYYYLLVKGSIETLNLKMLKLGRDLTDELFKHS